MPGFEVFGKEERKHVEDVMNSGILMRYNFDFMRNEHWKAKEFEEAIAQKLKTQYIHLVSSGTTALITALKSLGVGAGDEIIIPSFTFVASFEAVLFTGAIPVLVDIDETLTMNPIAIEKAISPRTKVIMPVHMCGAMADMVAIMEIAQKHHLYVLEDACQAIGATYRNQYLGTIGDIGCYSFDFVKTITCGEGGAIITHDSKLYEYCHSYSDHGHDHIGKDRGAENHPITGLNFRISELHAAVGLGQWEKLDEILARQRKIKSQFKQILQRYKAIRFRKILDEEGDNASFLSIFLENEEITRSVWQKLKDNGIPCAYWYDNNWHYVRKWNHFFQLKNDLSLAQEQRNGLPNYLNQDFSASDEIMKRTLTFPLSLNLSEEKINEIATKISNFVETQKIYS
jgi:8-amino-3,8-dideoxy-alpha-D-manno-octulosonate transaminase